MKKTDLRRQLLTEKMADHLLAQGLAGASLRPLAAAAGTSDRMLLHYFENKEDLLEATLQLISQRLTALLEAVRSEPMPLEALLPLLAGMLKDPGVRPYLRIWLDLASRAAHGDTLYQNIGRNIGEGFFEWIAVALQVDREEDRWAVASLALATLEGLVLLDALGMDAKVEAALEGLTRR